jgi:myo-inositol-1(or 4)-monophosphatase
MAISLTPLHGAAGVLLAAAAGAIVSDVEGRPWTLGSGSLVASGSQQVHDEILGLLDVG